MKRNASNRASPISAKRLDIDNISSGPVSGKVILFEWNCSENTLSPHLINGRKSYLDLRKKKNSGNSFFVPNTNVHSLPKGCLGVLVAFCDKAVSETKEDSIMGVEWKLGMLLSHAWHATTIVQISLGDKDYDYRYGKQIVEYSNKSSFSMRYLNVLSPKLVASDLTVVASLHGPDILPVPKGYKKRMAEPHILEPCVTYESGKSDGILKALQSGHAKLSRTMALAGTHIVVIEGPTSALNCDKYFCDDNGKLPFLVPFAKSASGVERKKFQDFGLFHGGAKRYKEVIASHPRLPNAFDNMLNSECTSYISLRSYNLTDHNIGLIFVFVANEEKKSNHIIHEFDSVQPMEHSDIGAKFNGVVLSHWSRHREFYQIGSDDVQLAHRVFGNHGFGNRTSVVSMGLNAYTGMRGSKRAIGNPVTSNKDIPKSQLYRSTFDVTYFPVLNKILNRLTKQAANVMVACNKSLDRFYFKVLKKLYPDASDDDLFSFRRFVNLSIYTSGNASDRTDTFFNTPHSDKTDVLFKEFQIAAHELLSELRLKTPNDPKLESDIQYLERLASACGGFAVPTVCGYDIVKSNTCSNESMAHFAQLGLGVTVQLCPQIYHLFFGSSYTHCTPMALSTQSDGKVTVFSNSDVNVVGWGGGKSVRRQIYDQFGGPPVRSLFAPAFRRWLETCNNQDAINEAERRNVLE